MDARRLPSPPGRYRPHDRRQLIALAGVAERTLRRFERGEPLTDASRRRIEAALRVLGLEPAATAKPAAQTEADHA